MYEPEKYPPMKDFERAMRAKDFIGAHAALAGAELESSERAGLHAVVFLYEERRDEARASANRAAAASESRFGQFLAAWTLAKLGEEAAARAILDRLQSHWPVSPYLMWLQSWLDWSAGADERIDDDRDAVESFGLEELAKRFPNTGVEPALRSLPDRKRFNLGKWRDVRAEFAWTDDRQLHIPIALDILPLEKYLPFHVARMPRPLQRLYWATRELWNRIDDGSEWIVWLWIVPLWLAYWAFPIWTWVKVLLAPATVLPVVAIAAMLPAAHSLTHWSLSLYPTTRRRLYVHAFRQSLLVWVLLSEMTVATGLWIAGWPNRTLGIGALAVLGTALAADRFAGFTQHSPLASLRTTLWMSLGIAGAGVLLFWTDLVRWLLPPAWVRPTLDWSHRLTVAAWLGFVVWYFAKDWFARWRMRSQAESAE